MEIIKVLDGCSSNIKEEHHAVLSNWGMPEEFKSIDLAHVKSGIRERENIMNDFLFQSAER